MSDIHTRYSRHADQFEAKLLAVRENAWELPSPCPDWTARDVVRHVTDTSRHFLGWVDVDPPGEDDLVREWRTVRSSVEEALRDPSVAGKILERPMGTQPFENFVDQYLSFDLVIHAWDLARAAGIDETLDQESILDVRDQAAASADVGRQMGAFGAEVPVADDADEQTRLLALLGRAV